MCSFLSTLVVMPTLSGPLKQTVVQQSGGKAPPLGMTAVLLQQRKQLKAFLEEISLCAAQPTQEVEDTLKYTLFHKNDQSRQVETGDKDMYIVTSAIVRLTGGTRECLSGRVLPPPS